MSQSPLTLTPTHPSTQYQTHKFLLFNLGKLNLALPIAQVIKILNYQTGHGSGTTSTGLVHLEGRSVTLIDLHQRLFKVPAPAVAVSKRFLILAKNSSKEEFCLLVNNTPTLVDVPHSEIRLLPDSYRRNDTLSCATQVMIIKQKQQDFTVFVLDPDRLIGS